MTGGPDGNNQTLTGILAELATGTSRDALTEEACDAAKRLVLDSMACAIAAVDQPGCRDLLELVRETGGRREASLLGYGGQAPMEQAAFLNGLLIHALDYDDIYPLASLHVCSVLLPCCLAAAQKANASGTDFLDAMIVGAEVACLLGDACVGRRGGLGFLPTTVEGGFGAVAGASRLLGLSAGETMQAMGLYYAQAAGNRQALADGVLAKRIQPAFAARNAMWSVRMAQQGITGPPRALEGAFGLFQTYYRHEPPLPEALRRGSDDPWRIEHIAIKPYTSCGGCHALIDAALRLSDKHDLDPAAVDHVEIAWGGAGRNAMVGHPFRLEPDPQVSAQFSAPYCVALALVRRTQSIEAFRAETIRADMEVIEFSRRVRGADCAPPPRQPTPDWFPGWYGDPHSVRVFMKDGALLHESSSLAQVRSKASDGWNAVVAKWHSCLAFSGLSGRLDADSLIQTIQGLDEAATLDSLLDHSVPWRS
ncbi:MAG: MmgE/PrpD family protein [Candidatus Marinimicrobia bacterium]|nr:MmgE/PrpD family protein [Candidatus Neomarinimicrobiota bacterium]